MTNLIIKKSPYEFNGCLKLANEKLNADQTPKVTFWGTRIVKFDNQDVSLNDLIRRICILADLGTLVDLTEIKHIHTLEDRIAGIEIGKKLINYHELTDEQIENSNFITRFLVWIRERKIVWIQNGYRDFPLSGVPATFF